MSNFEFLKDKAEYESFSKKCIDAEETFKDSPTQCVLICRSALEGAIKWVYAHDRKMIINKNIGNNVSDDVSISSLFKMINSEPFKSSIGTALFNKIDLIRRKGNQTAHGSKNISPEEAQSCLIGLFDFIQWVDKNYGINYKSRNFSADDMPSNPSFLGQVAKYAGAAVGGAAALALWLFVNGDDKK